MNAGLVVGLINPDLWQQEAVRALQRGITRLPTPRPAGAGVAALLA